MPSEFILLIAHQFLFTGWHLLVAMTTEGVFRVAGARDRILELTEQINAQQFNGFSRDENSANISGLLKQFLRDLPQPLLPVPSILALGGMSSFV
jgi:hypothetical protein